MLLFCMIREYCALESRDIVFSIYGHSYVFSFIPFLHLPFHALRTKSAHDMHTTHMLYHFRLDTKVSFSCIYYICLSLVDCYCNPL